VHSNESSKIVAAFGSHDETAGARRLIKAAPIVSGASLTELGTGVPNEKPYSTAKARRCNSLRMNTCAKRGRGWVARFFVSRNLGSWFLWSVTMNLRF
jgi:hypothetical protein